MAQTRITLPGSERQPIPGAQLLADVETAPDPDQQLTITILVRRKQELSAHAVQSGDLTREQLIAEYGASAEDFLAVRRFVEEYGLTYDAASEDALSRTVNVTGTIQNLQQAFGATLRNARVGDAVYRERTGTITLPAEVASIIEDVAGLDNRPGARPHLRFRPAALASQGFSPLDVARLYNFPPGTGAGQTIAIIELGGGFVQSDLDTYFAELGVPSPQVTAVSVLGAANNPDGNPGGPDGEVMLDIEVAGAVAPNAEIKVYFAPNTDQGFLQAVNAAIRDTPTPAAISISWGKPENAWTRMRRRSFEQAFQNAAALKALVTVASGDNGSTDGTNTLVVDFPAAAPHALSCGGTHLQGGAAITHEEVWNDGFDTDGVFWATGGGVSAAFPRPDYQQNVTLPTPIPPGGGRGVPDVCGEAASPGYKVRVDGLETTIGGTSAVAPLWAGLIARLAEKLGHGVPFLNPILYANPGVLRDIQQGNNDINGGSHYKASVGWDACTGLGSPNGAALLAVLNAGQSPTPTPTPAPVPGAGATGQPGSGALNPLQPAEPASPMSPVTPASPPSVTNTVALIGVTAVVAVAMVGIVAAVAAADRDKG